MNINLHTGEGLDITFIDEHMERLCVDEKYMVKTLGKLCAKKLRTRLNELSVAANLNELVTGRPHPLYGKFEGCVGLELHGGYRLVVRPDHTPVPTLKDGGLDRKSVTCVIVIYVGDYHD